MPLLVGQHRQQSEPVRKVVVRSANQRRLRWRLIETTRRGDCGVRSFCGVCGFRCLRLRWRWVAERTTTTTTMQDLLDPVLLFALPALEDFLRDRVDGAECDEDDRPSL